MLQELEFSRFVRDPLRSHLSDNFCKKLNLNFILFHHLCYEYKDNNDKTSNLQNRHKLSNLATELEICKPHYGTVGLNDLQSLQKC